MSDLFSSKLAPIHQKYLDFHSNDYETCEGWVSTCWSGWRWSSSFLPFCRLHGHTSHKGIVHAHQDVLWFDISVDDFTFAVQVVQTLQDLQRNQISRCNLTLKNNTHTSSAGGHRRKILTNPLSHLSCLLSTKLAKLACFLPYWGLFLLFLPPDFRLWEWSMEQSYLISA